MSDKPNKTTIEGTVIVIGELQEFASGFVKRLLVVQTDEEKYAQAIPVEFVKDRTKTLDALSVGDWVRVEADIRGNEYNGKYYCNITGWRIEDKDGREFSSRTPRDQAPAAAHPEEDDNDPLQF